MTTARHLNPSIQNLSHNLLNSVPSADLKSSEVEMLFQKLGNQWYAFSAHNEEVYRICEDTGKLSPSL